MELDEKPQAAKAFLDAIDEYKRLQDEANDQSKYRTAINDSIFLLDKLGRATAGEARMIGLWEDCLRRVPTDVTALNSLAWWLSVANDSTLRDPARAVELARQAVKVKPNVASYHNTLGTALYRADKLTEARAELEKSVELKSTAPAMDWYLLAAIAHREGKPDEARELFGRAAAEHQKNQPKDEDHAVIAAEVKALLRE